MRRLVILLPLAVGCGNPLAVGPKITDIARIANPTGTIDAVVRSIYYDEGGLGESQTFRVLLVPHGRPVRENSSVVLELRDGEGYEKDGDWRPEWKANDKILFRFKHVHVLAYDNEPFLTGSTLVGAQLQIAYYGGHWPEEPSLPNKPASRSLRSRVKNS